jgi:hypothetical protein
MNFSDFWTDNKENIVYGILVIIGIVLVVYIFKGYFRKNEFAKIENKGYAYIYGHTAKKCLDVDVQKQIANDISRKLEEINACNCDDKHSGLRKRLDLSESQIQMEGFGNDDFY